MMMSKSWLKLQFIRKPGGFYRTLVVDTKVEEDLEVPKRKYVRKKPLESKASKDLLTYFSTPERENVLTSYPQQLYRKKSGIPEGLYNTSPKTARIIVDHLKKDLLPDRQLLELFPGQGHITKLLANETTNQLLLYEPEKDFLRGLTGIVSSSKNKNVVLKNLDLTSLWKMAFIDKLDHGKRVDEALQDISKKDYDNEPNLRMFLSTCSLPFIKHLINSIVFQNSLVLYGRCEFYMCLPPPLYMHLTCSKEAGYMMFRSYSVLFQLLFEYEFICRLPRKDFLPWQAELKAVRYAKIRKFTRLDPESIYLVRAVPRKNLFKYILPDMLVAFWFFVKQHMISRKNRVIPMMERWVPNCGPRIIVNPKAAKPPTLVNPSLDRSSLPPLSQPCYELTNEDFLENADIFTEFGDLTPTQILTLFDQFVNWPEFRECSFNASLENAMIKFHTNPDDTADSRNLLQEVEDEEKKEN